MATATNVNRTLSSSFSNSVINLPESSGNLQNQQDINSNEPSPSPVLDSPSLKQLTENAKRSPDRVQPIVNAALTKAVRNADCEAVTILLSIPNCGPSPETLERAKNMAAVQKISSVGDFSDMSTDVLENSRKMKQVYNVIKKELENKKLNQTPSE